MELDEMKNLWDKVNKVSENTNITKEKILKMLQSSYKGAMKSLLKYEFWGLILVLPAAFLLIIIYQLQYKESGIIQILTFVFTATCIIGFFWQLYKYKYLKKIDTATMNILQISEKMLVYRKYIVHEFIFGIMFFIMFMTPYIYGIYSINFSKKTIIIYMITSILAFLLMLHFYKKWYFNNINKIQEALAEIEDFQKENETEE